MLRAVFNGGRTYYTKNGIRQEGAGGLQAFGYHRIAYDTVDLEDYEIRIRRALRGVGIKVLMAEQVPGPTRTADLHLALDHFNWA